MAGAGDPGPAPPAVARRRRLIGRLIVTAVLLGGLGGGYWAVAVGKRLAKERKARVLAPGAPEPRVGR